VPSRFARVVWAVLACAATGCDDRAPVERCSSPLGGVWQANALAPSGEPYRYHLLDHGSTLELYPIFDDALPPDGTSKRGEIIYAPAVIDLKRDGERLYGTESRRLTRGPRRCIRRLPAEISSCDRGELLLAVAVTDGLDWERCTPQLTGERLELRLHRAR
jgi:hypothetical protein